MNKKLSVLCESQLNAVLHEAEAAFTNIINSATASIRLSKEIYSVDKDAANSSHELEQRTERLSALGTEMQKIMIYLQFHDEFSQRINHVIELCRLQREKANIDEVDEIDEQLFHRIKGIFSVSSEFSVLQTLFPEFKNDSSDEAVELF
jgi:uncharacterized protein YigA (DUF484 family)